MFEKKVEEKRENLFLTEDIFFSEMNFDFFFYKFFKIKIIEKKKKFFFTTIKKKIEKKKNIKIEWVKNNQFHYMNINQILKNTSHKNSQIS